MQTWTVRKPTANNDVLADLKLNCGHIELSVPPWWPSTTKKAHLFLAIHMWTPITRYETITGDNSAARDTEIKKLCQGSEAKLLTELKRLVEQLEAQQTKTDTAAA